MGVAYRWLLIFERMVTAAGAIVVMSVCGSVLCVHASHAQVTQLSESLDTVNHDTARVSPGAPYDKSKYVQIDSGHFVLDGNPFVLKGTNYFGSWRYQHTIDAGNGIEQDSPWILYGDGNVEKLAADFNFIRSTLKATAVRIGTPSDSDFAPLVKFHGYRPWYAADGTITPFYAAALAAIADVAYKSGIRIQFCLLWNIGNEIVGNPDEFKTGGSKDKFYANQVRSVAAVLSKHPGVIGYSVGNEVLIKWPINGQQKSWYEVRAAGFILRRIRDVRAAAPAQLISTDELAAPGGVQWYSPSPELAQLSDVDTGHGVEAIRLADSVDYIGIHFYPESVSPAQTSSDFAAKIDDARAKLVQYGKASMAIGKPVVITEFGLPPPSSRPIPRQFADMRDEFFRAIVRDSESLGFQGLLAWGAVPELVLKPGKYIIIQSTLNKYSPVEVDIDGADRRHRRVIFCTPEFNLFEWGDYGAEPHPTAAAKALASAWSAH